jgi:hypothetical protein
MSSAPTMKQMSYTAEQGAYTGQLAYPVLRSYLLCFDRKQASDRAE